MDQTDAALSAYLSHTVDFGEIDGIKGWTG